MNRRITAPGLIVIFMIIFGCAVPQETTHDESFKAETKIDLQKLQSIFSGIFPVYPRAVIISSDKCHSGSQLCSAKLAVDARKNNVMNFYKIAGKQKGWIFDKEVRAKNETSSLANQKLWGLMNFTCKSGEFKSLTIIIPSDKHTGSTKTTIDVTLMNPPDKISFSAPSIPATEKIDIGKSVENDEWKIKIEYVKYEGNRVEVKDSDWMKPAVIGDAVAGYYLVRVRAHLERFGGKPIKDAFLKIAVTIRASNGKAYGPIGARGQYGEFYDYGRGGTQSILIPVTEKSDVDYVFAIPVRTRAEAFIWPNMQPVSLVTKKPTTPASPEAERIAARTTEFLSKGMYDDAIREAGEALGFDPNNAQALEKRAESYRMKGEYDKAIRDADRLLRIQPDNAYTLKTRASAFWAKKQFDEAILDASRALEIEPNSAFALKYRADAYRMKGNYGKAIQDATRALGIHPNDAFVIRTRAESFRSNGNYDEAIKDADRALQIKSDDAFALTTRSAALWAQGKHVEAIQDATRALEIEPNSLSALKYRADSNRMGSNYDAAIRDADRALAIDPNNAFALRTRAEAYRMKGNYDLAIRDAKRSLEIEPGDGFAKRTLAEAEKMTTSPKIDTSKNQNLCEFTFEIRGERYSVVYNHDVKGNEDVEDNKAILKLTGAIVDFTLPAARLAKPLKRASVSGNELINAIEFHKPVGDEKKAVMIFRFATAGRGKGPGNVGISWTAGFTLDVDKNLLAKMVKPADGDLPLTGKFSAGKGCSIAQDRAKKDLRGIAVKAPQFTSLLGASTDCASFFGFVLFSRVDSKDDPYFEFNEDQSGSEWHMRHLSTPGT